MTDPALYEKLTAIFHQIFQDQTIALRAETSEADIAGWDSFSNASLIAAIEKAFAIRFRGWRTLKPVETSGGGLR